MDNNQIYGETTGCDSVHYALVTTDTKEKYEAGVPKYLAPAADVAFEYGETLTPRYYDNVAFFMDTDDGDTKISIVFSGVPNDEAAIVLGLPYDAETGMLVETTPKPPWVAVSCRTSIAGGNHMYYQYLKGKFTRSSKKATSKGANTTYNTCDLVYTTAKTVHKFLLPDGAVDGIRGITGATTDEKFTAADTWFEKVQMLPEPSSATQTTNTTDSEE